MSLEDYKKKFNRACHKCEQCGKVYKLPGYIFEPREKICFTCELNQSAIQALNYVVNNYKTLYDNKK